MIVPVSVMLPNPAHWAMRLFATMKDGSQRSPDLGSNGVFLGTVDVTSFRFSSNSPLNPDDVVSYDLEMIPYTYVAINHIALSPGVHVGPTAKITPPDPMPAPKHSGEEGL